jgi:hypothetical protein
MNLSHICYDSLQGLYQRMTGQLQNQKRRLIIHTSSEIQTHNPTALYERSVSECADRSKCPRNFFVIVVVVVVVISVILVVGTVAG